MKFSLGKVVVLIVAAAVAIAVGQIGLKSGMLDGRDVRSAPDHIEVFFPFGFSAETDPRHVYTVADQVLCEHLFAFHGTPTFKGGFRSVVSSVTFETEEGTIRVRPSHKLQRSDGSEVSLKDQCRALESSFRGTLHAPLASLLKGVECNDREILIHLNGIPVNMTALLSLPDFSIFDPGRLPISNANLVPTTGPYYLASVSGSKAELRRNHFYPRELTANAIERVSINKYPASKTRDFIRDIDASKQHLAYFFGHALRPEDLDQLRLKHYQVEVFPSEWMVHLGFQKSLPLADRRVIAAVADELRPRLEAESVLGVPAFSVPPADRPFGFNKSTYEAMVSKVSSPKNLSQPITVGTMDYWYEQPVFRTVIDSLKARFPEKVTVRILSPDQFKSLYEPGIDVYMSVQGISQADPTHHLAFFLKSDPIFGEVTSTEEIVRISTLSKAEDFQEAVRGVERKILDRRAIVPLLHFPGIVASATGFERDESLAGSWGIRAWTYRVR